MTVRFFGQSGGLARSYDAATVAWQAAVVLAGGSVSYARLAVVDQLVYDLKTAVIWTGLDRLWLHAAENTQQALIDLKAVAVATAVNSPTFTANRGYTGNGTSSYIDTNFNASTAGGNFTRNEAGMGVWVETAPAASSAVIGNNDSSYSAIVMVPGSNLRQVNINAATNSGTFAATSHTGFLHGERTGANAVAGFRNGVSETSSATASVALTNQTHKILANVSSGGTLASWSDARVSAAFIGASLTGKEAAFYTAMRTYMTAVGVP